MIQYYRTLCVCSFVDATLAAQLKFSLSLHILRNFPESCRFARKLKKKDLIFADVLVYHGDKTKTHQNSKFDVKITLFTLKRTQMNKKNYVQMKIEIWIFFKILSNITEVELL